MKGKLHYVGLDGDLFSFLEVSLQGDYICKMCSPSEKNAWEADLLIWDTDSYPFPEKSNSDAKMLTVGYKGNPDIRRPFSFAGLSKLLSGEKDGADWFLSPVSSSLFYPNGEIKLTRVQYTVFSILVQRNGETVGVQTLLEALGGNATIRSLTVAISELRHKLENKKSLPEIGSVRGVGYRLVR